MRDSAQLFEVQILYREPLHELWSGNEGRSPFVARYRRIQAHDDLEAARIAQDRFDDLARESQVKWRRQVVEIRVQPVVA